MSAGSRGGSAGSCLLGIPGMGSVTRMASESKDVSHINNFCGYCQFFGDCETEYGDYACWEYVEDEAPADNGPAG